jgi:TolB-like protein/lipoprotein NlpI
VNAGRGIDVAQGDGEERTAGAAGATRAVFVSYASQDASIATTVVEALERSGVACWIAPRDVTPGAFYADEIVHAINAAKAIVLILSKNAADSQHVLREVEHAASKRHPVVSLRVDQAPLPAGLGYFLNTSQWLDASGVEIARSMPKLIAAVRVAIQAPIVTPEAAPTPRVPAASSSARSSKRTAIIMASLIGLAFAGFAVDRLWVSNRGAAPISVPTAAVPAPAPAPAAPTIPEKSVAVLPFLNMSEDKNNEYFSDGLSEELIDMLTKIPDLRVPARTSSFYFKGKQTTIGDIAKALNVSHVLEGSVRKSGKTLRITAQLIRVDNGYHVWSETYDRQLDDIFKVQDEIAAAVVSALKVTLLAGKTPKATATSSNEAYTLYLQARAIITNAPQLADDQRAFDCLQRALKLDPQFARAWAALASFRVSDYLYYGSGNYQQVLAEARYAAEQSLTLDPTLSDAHLAMGQILYALDWNWKAAEVEVNKALALDPGDADALARASDIALTQGRFDAGLQLAQRAVALDPLGAWKYGAVGNAYKASGRLIEAEAAYRQALEVAPTMSQLHLMVGWVLVARGEPTAALAEMEQETDDTYRHVGRAMALDALSRKGEADRELAVTEAKYAREAEFPIAMVYANRNDRDTAFAWLERAYQQHDDWLQWIPGEPLMKNLRGDPRYKAFLRKMNLPES